MEHWPKLWNIQVEFKLNRIYGGLMLGLHNDYIRVQIMVELRIRVLIRIRV